MRLKRERSSSVAGAAAAVMLVTFLSKLLGFGREAALAAVFGANRVTDAYLVAMVIPGMIFGVVASALTTVGIPVFSEYLHREEKRQEFFSLVWSCFHAILLFLLLVCALAVLGASLLVRLLAPGFGEEQAALTAGLVRVILPSIVFMGLAGWAQGVLNTFHHFVVPAAVGIPYNIIMIFGIFLSGAFWGIEGVAWVTLVAVASQFLIQLPVLRRFGVDYRREFDLRHPALVKMGRLLLPVLIGVGANQMNIVVDRVLASGLAEGSISALNYAQRALAVPQGLLAAPLITVLYPSLAECGAVGDMDGLRRRLGRGLETLAFLVIPLSVALIVLRSEFVGFFFQRGAFDAQDAAMTSVALLFFSLGLLFVVWRDYLARAFYALQDTATPMWTGVAAVVVNIAVNLVLVRYLAHGGLALGSSLAALVGCLLLVVLLRKRLGFIGGRELLRQLVKMAVASGAGAAAVCWLRGALSGFDRWMALEGLVRELLGGGGLAAFAAQGLRLALLLGVGALVYLFVCWLLRVRELGSAQVYLHRLKARVSR